MMGDKSLFAVCMVDSLFGTASGEDCAVIHTHDGGVTWQEQEAYFLPHGWLVSDYAGIIFENRYQGMMVGSLGLVVETNNGGATWDWVTAPEIGDVNAVVKTGPDTGLIAGQNGAIITFDAETIWD